MSPVSNGVYTAEFKYEIGSPLPWRFRILKDGKPIAREYASSWETGYFSTGWTAKRRAKRVMRRLRKADRMNGGWHK